MSVSRSIPILLGVGVVLGVILGIIFTIVYSLEEYDFEVCSGWSKYSQARTCQQQCATLPMKLSGQCNVVRRAVQALERTDIAIHIITFATILTG